MASGFAYDGGRSADAGDTALEVAGGIGLGQSAPAVAVRGARVGPPHSGSALVEAILIVAPSNRARPAVLATDTLPDLHVIDPATRALPRF